MTRVIFHIEVILKLGSQIKFNLSDIVATLIPHESLSFNGL